MGIIALTKGKTALVDDDDFEWLSQWRWCITAERGEPSPKQGYAARRIPTENGKQRTLYMHRLIAHAPSGMEVDHINGDTLDNRRSNLRLATRQENAHNQRKHTGGVSHTAYKGITSKKGRWYASIHSKGKTTHLGAFATAEQAATAYDRAARDQFGQFARTNFQDHSL